MNELILHINGQLYQGWKRVSVTRSLEGGPHQFQVEAAPGLDADNGLFALSDGMPVELFVNDERITSGYIDELDIRYDHRSASVTIRGRSKLGDLVDCSGLGKQYKEQSLASIARTLCQPFGIEVIIDPNASAAANDVFKQTSLTLDAGQTLWQFLEELARLRAVLLISDADGNLIISRSGQAQTSTALELGKNILSASASRSHRGLFSCIQVVGDPAPGKYIGAPPAIIGHAEGRAERHRPQVVMADTPSDQDACDAQAQHQRNVNWGRSRRITYKMQGWRASNDGPLWMPNQLIRVTDPRLQLDDQERLITSVRFAADTRSGQTTELTLMPKEAFDLRAQPEGPGRGYIL